MALRLRRLPDAVEVVIEGTGPAPVLQQAAQGNGWRGQLLTAQPSGLRFGPQRLALPEAGLQSVALQGSGSSFQIEVTPLAGAPLARPVVSADGSNLVITFPTASQVLPQSARFDVRTPGRVPQPTYAPPLQPRAVAPPLGDMAVGSMVLRNRSFINVSGPAVSMTMRNAPAKDVLMALAQMGGYGFVYVEAEGQGAATTPSAGSKPVSITFRGESYARAFNSVLLASGLQGKIEGNMIFAGPGVLGKTFGPQLSKIYRLNQASAASAADYLASLGASITKVSVITNSVTQGQAQANQVAGAAQSAQTQTQSITTTETYGSGSGPLKGLSGTTDSRLQTITLVGEAPLVAVAENYLRQLDLRQRQVALSVKILDVSLDNDAVVNNSFAFRYGNNFIVNDNGQLLAAFGRNLPPSADDVRFGSPENVTSSSTTNSASGSSSGSGFSSSASQSASQGQTSSSSRSVINTDISSNQLTDTQIRTLNSTLAQTGLTLERAFSPLLGREGFAVVPISTSASGTNFAATDQISRILSSTLGRSVNLASSSSATGSSSSGTTGNSNNSGSRTGGSSSSNSTGTARDGFRRENAGMLYPKDNFFDFVQAVITSSSTKVLASPTLILSENQDEIKGGVEASAQLSSGGSSSGSSSGFGGATIGRPRANESFVTVGQQVTTSYNVVQGANNTGNTCEPEFSIAGLTFGARVAKIDDNGFVTFTLSPQITAAVDKEFLPGCGFYDILSVRRLDTGSARVRDGQTLILTGVISDADQQLISKWPILGDLPLIGQFFRSSSGTRNKRELVIMVTPRIIDDSNGGTYGYGYQPSTREARQFVSSPSQGAGLY
ncbi:type II secretion system protein GspD [Vulcanococcus limneticus]|uniref:type II secretion system protein GspD n=1 Tax=Vulcanococcus limneticus TaxID=2170428 RepID=UPI00398BE9DE